MDPRRTLREMLQSAPVARAAASHHGPRAAPLLTMPLNTDKNTHSTPSKCKGGVWKELYFLSHTRAAYSMSAWCGGCRIFRRCCNFTDSFKKPQMNQNPTNKKLMHKYSTRPIKRSSCRGQTETCCLLQRSSCSGK